MATLKASALLRDKVLRENTNAKNTNSVEKNAMMVFFMGDNDYTLY
jgi:hypothetical protein